MEKVIEFVKKNWMWIAVIVIVSVAIYLKRKKESGFSLPSELEGGGICPNNCCDCGPGGIFGPGWTMEKFQKSVNESRKRARELSGGISDSEFELAIKRSGGLIPYIEGRETNVKRLEEATSNLNGVMNIPGVHGIGSMMGGYIEIAVIDEVTKQKVMKFIEEKKKAMLMIPSHGKGYMGYPVKIVIREQSKAQ